MKISQKTTYGMCFMLRLAISTGDNYININEIAKSANISEKYLENVVAILKSSDLINIKLGSEGGYKLSKQPGQIKLKKIYEVLNGSIQPQESPGEGGFEMTPIKQSIYDLWDDFRLKMAEYLESRTLEDLANDYKKKHYDHLFYSL
ncbi:MAG: Rrf2 family transcriptional regulator [Chlorobi bacterium]|nr:Rrf2 family transcriptional regulator [Chlorobiota bacterium]